MASPTLLTPTSKPKQLTVNSFKPTISTTITTTSTIVTLPQIPRRQFLSLAAGLILTPTILLSTPSAWAATDDEYIKETSEVIGKIRTTINLDKKDPNVATASSDLREASNAWVAKYRRDKALLSRASFRDMYSALNAVSGHYISFGPTAPIPAKRKQRILQEMDTVEKALLRGR